MRSFSVKTDFEKQAAAVILKNISLQRRTEKNKENNHKLVHFFLNFVMNFWIIDYQLNFDRLHVENELSPTLHTTAQGTLFPADAGGAVQSRAVQSRSFYIIFYFVWLPSELMQEATSSQRPFVTRAF